MNIGGNGGLQIPVPVPDLGALGGQNMDPAAFAQQTILSGAGITPGGRAVVTVDNGRMITLDKVEIPVMAMPAAIHILITGTIDDVPTVIPWHAVTKLRAG